MHTIFYTKIEINPRKSQIKETVEIDMSREAITTKSTRTVVYRHALPHPQTHHSLTTILPQGQSFTRTRPFLDLPEPLPRSPHNHNRRRSSRRRHSLLPPPRRRCSTPTPS